MLTLIKLTWKKNSATAAKTRKADENSDGGDAVAAKPHADATRKTKPPSKAAAKPIDAKARKEAHRRVAKAQKADSDDDSDDGGNSSGGMGGIGAEHIGKMLLDVVAVKAKAKANAHSVSDSDADSDCAVAPHPRDSAKARKPAYKPTRKAKAPKPSRKPEATFLKKRDVASGGDDDDEAYSRAVAIRKAKTPSKSSAKLFEEHSDSDPDVFFVPRETAKGRKPARKYVPKSVRKSKVPKSVGKAKAPKPAPKPTKDNADELEAHDIVEVLKGEKDHIGKKAVVIAVTRTKNTTTIHTVTIRILDENDAEIPGDINKRPGSLKFIEKRELS